MKRVFIFDFDGTFYSGECKFNKVRKNVEDNKRNFMKRLNDCEYNKICQENPRWLEAITGNDIVRCMIRLMKKYKNLNISIEDFYNWQKDFIYDIIIDNEQIVDTLFLKKLCESYPVYVVSNSSLKHIYYYMEKLNVDTNWFKQIIGNEFKKEDPTKQHYYNEIMVKENVDSHNIYVLGDSVESDLTPALHLCMNAFYVCNANNIKSIVTSILNNKI